MVGWDEIYHPDLPKSILIQSWQGQDALGQVAQNGYKGILSTGFYLDQPQSTAYHYRNEIVPQGLNGVDVIADTDSVQSWAFSMPRLKGKPVEGSFTLVKGDAGWRGFIDFAGKSRRAVDNIQWRDDNQVTFTVDTGWVKRVRSFLLRTISSAAISWWVTPATRLAARVWTRSQRHTAGGAGPGERGQSARR